MTVKRLRDPAGDGKRSEGSSLAPTYKGFATQAPAEAGPIEPPVGAGPDQQARLHLPAHRRRRRSRRGRLLGWGLAILLPAAAGLALVALRPTAPPPPAQTELAPLPAPPSALAMTALRGPQLPGEGAAVLEPTPSVAPGLGLQAPSAPPQARRATPAAPTDACARRTQAFARAACRDPDLAVLDRELNSAFAEAMADGDARGRLAAEHEDWVIQRDRLARTSPEALKDLYHYRIAQLRELKVKGADAGVSAPPTPQPSP